MAKKLFGIVLPLIILFCLCSCGASVPKADGFGLFLTNGGRAQGAEIHWFAHRNGEHYLFLPAGAYGCQSDIVSRFPGHVIVNGVTVKNGDRNDVITHDGRYTVSYGKGEFVLNVISSENLPALFIETESGSLEKIHADKEYKEAGSLRVFEYGAFSEAQVLSSVKGRGHTTWEFDKKPYNIKFAEKTPLLGMDAAKKWCLLANAADPSLIRTDIAFALAKEIGIPYTCDSRHADVYINGDYQGNYLVTEAVETAQDRVEITDLDDLNEAANPGVVIKELPLRSSGGPIECGSRRWTDIPVSPADITGGYLLEYDAEDSYANETNGFVSAGGQYVTVKSPERASEKEIDYISSYVSEAEEALLSENGYNSEGRHFSEYYDMKSLARMYVLNELLYAGSLGSSSTFFSKDTQGKLMAGPGWDFDECLANPYRGIYKELVDPGLRCLALVICNEDTMLPSVYSLAFRHEEFVRETASVWRDFSPVIASDRIREKIDGYSEENARSAVCDYFRWNDVVIQSPEEREAVYKAQYAAPLISFLEARKAFAEKEFSGDPVLLFYDCGDVRCFIFENTPTCLGDRVNVKSIEDNWGGVMLPEGYRFREWNTEKDGSGESYQPGDEITLDRLCTTLYAQWDKASP